MTCVLRAIGLMIGGSQVETTGSKPYLRAGMQTLVTSEAQLAGAKISKSPLRPAAAPKDGSNNNQSAAKNQRRTHITDYLHDQWKSVSNSGLPCDLVLPNAV